VPDPLRDRGRALAGGPARVLRLGRRHPHHGAHPPLAPGARHHRPQQRLGVDPVGLGPPGPPVHRDRGRVDRQVLDAVGDEAAVQPEAVAARLVAGHGPDGSPGPALGRGALSADELEQLGRGARGQLVAADLLAAGGLDRRQPARAAQRQGDEEDGLLGTRGGRVFRGSLLHRTSPSGLEGDAGTLARPAVTATP
jgi:hypothetical protein